MKKLNKQDIHDILHGSVILGTGGGGDLNRGLKLIEEATALNKDFMLVDINEVPDDALIVTPYSLGAISKLPKEELKKYEDLPICVENPFIIAVEQLEKYFDKRISGTIACETGGSNTAIPMYLAALRDGVILDADIAGRAVPEVTNSTYYIHKLPVSPVFVSNQFGEVAILENIKDDARAEDILRSFAMISKNNISVIDHASPMSKLKDAIIPGTLTKALQIGQAYRQAKEKKEDVTRAVATAADGIIAFTGTIKQFEWKTESGFTIGSLQVQGTGKCDSDRLKVWFQNENLMSWLNDEVFVTLPDLICIIDTDKEEPVTNPNYHEQMNIAVIVCPAPEPFTTSEGLKAFGPKRFGFEVDYRPAIGRIEAI
jgi:uncharacterized protein